MQTIFLTSLPRCGSTWAGRTLASMSGSRYIHEPFNWVHYPERKTYFMRYMRARRNSRSPAGRDPYDVGLRRILDDSIREHTGPWRLARQGIRRRELRSTLHAILGRRRVLIKEVFCSLAAERVQEHLNAAVVILVRHPCGMANSWKRLDYMAPFWLDTLLRQEVLLEEHLGEFESHLRSSSDPLFQVGAYWGASYYILSRLARAHPEWQWVTHGELCREPEAAFRQILERVGANVRNGTSKFLAEHNRPAADDEDAYSLYRDTTSEPQKWRTMLSPEEVREVMRGAEPFGVEALMRGPPRDLSAMNREQSWTPVSGTHGAGHD